ncbi:response regulator transcription factor [Clostridium grantii]|uniref:Stage 0 sporulation protein A homolog n=1 Tax=Clostridium grantii DSM 8605 TaxID=1121316 RepID=A0A1M5WD87_9CLOT|nr:response regulator transcription factor [Clostridium grantii]SHH85174.1 two-component system, OmpR family, response regulator CssR [Clostridium grantii DSM 8605]
MYSIYLVEDEERLRKLLVLYLEKEGYKIKSFSNGEDALNHIYDDVDLWILDIGLPGIDGFELITNIKKSNEDMPVIFTSARDSEMDRIMGLKFGSDDYLTKPFSVQELILRVDKLLKRVYKKEKINKFEYGIYTIDITNRTVFQDHDEIKLTSKEFDLLLLFLKNTNRAYSREEILKFVWNEFYGGTDRVIDDTIRRLRKKMPTIKLETIYGYGYRML